MPNPVRSDVHVDRPLTNISTAYIQSASNFIADKVFPNIPVSKQSDKYFTYDKADFNRTEARERAPSTESAGAGWRMSTDSYLATVFAVHKDIDDQIRANQDDPINLDREAALFVTNQLLIKRDKIWVANYFATGKWGTDRTGVASGPTGSQFIQWNESASDPIVDIRKSMVDTHAATGYTPNTLVLGLHVWRILADHGDLLERIKYTQGPAMPSPALVAQLLDLDRVLISRAVETTTEEEAATDTVDLIAGKHALLVYANPTPSLMTPSGGYTFSWTGYTGAGANGNRINRIRMDAIRSDRIEGEMAFDAKLVSSDVGVFYSGAVA